jgi:hypothetical protein
MESSVVSKSDGMFATRATASRQWDALQAKTVVRFHLLFRKTLQSPGWKSPTGAARLCVPKTYPC